MDENSSVQQAGIDRRAALKKAAVAGGIIWSAPLIASSVVDAQAITCTPKCAPTQAAGLNASVGLYCTSSGDKWAQLTLLPNSGTGVGTCPCSGASTMKFCVEPPSFWDKGNSQNFAITVCSNGGVLVITKPNQGGALGKGDYTTSAPAKVAVGCPDRTGHISWQVCSYDINFSYDPGDGPCSQTANVGSGGAKLVADSCYTYCTGPGVECPFTTTPCTA